MNENNKNSNINGVRPTEPDPARRPPQPQTQIKQGEGYTVRRVVRPGQGPSAPAQKPVQNQPQPKQAEPQLAQPQHTQPKQAQPQVIPTQTQPVQQRPAAQPVKPQTSPQPKVNPQAQPAQPHPQPAAAQKAAAPKKSAQSPRAQVKQAAAAEPEAEEKLMNNISKIYTQPTSSTRVMVKKKRYKNPNSGSGFSSIIKALVYIVCVVGVSLIISYLGIIIANDVFAFVKDDEEMIVTIPEYMTTGELADILYEEGVIKYPFVFKIYCGRNDNGKLEFVPGEYVVNANTSYDKLFTMFQKSTKRETVRIAFPEGLTIDEIITLLVDNGVGTREGFIEVINEYDFLGAGYEYDFLEKLVVKPERHYRLEGYLYPDTYDFYKSRELDEEDVKETGVYIYADEVAAIAKFLNRFKQVFTEDLLLRVEELNMTLDEVITLASIIEKEGKYVVEFENISSVFHNRMNHKATYPKLQSDATTAYAIQCLEGKRPDEILPSHNDIDHPYNTYVYDGLPPSAIANPGYNAITCALYPSTTEYYYFISKKDGTTLFAKTQDEHLENIVIARSEQAG